MDPVFHDFGREGRYDWIISRLLGESVSPMFDLCVGRATMGHPDAGPARPLPTSDGSAGEEREATWPRPNGLGLGQVPRDPKDGHDLPCFRPLYHMIITITTLYHTLPQSFVTLPPKHLSL